MDIIKGIAIIMVIMVHNRHFIMLDMSGLRQLINYGQMGCQLFFFVSGFSLCYAWEKMEAAKPDRHFIPAGILFILRRYLRLIPGFLIIMFINWHMTTFYSNHIDYPVGFVMNQDRSAMITTALFMHGLSPDFINNVFPGGWYIGTAFLLYITFPLLFLLFKLLSRIHYICLTLIPLLLFFSNRFLLEYLAATYGSEFYPSNNSFTYFLFTNHLTCFGLGILLYFFEKKDFSVKCPFVISAVISAAAAYWSMRLYILPETDDYLYAMLPSLVGFAAFWMAAAFTHVEKKLMKLSWKIPPFFLTEFLASCGRHSYGMYLVHSFVSWHGLKMLRYFLTLNENTYNDISVYWKAFVPSILIVYVIGLGMDQVLSAIDSMLRGKIK